MSRRPGIFAALATAFAATAFAPFHPTHPSRLAPGTLPPDSVLVRPLAFRSIGPAFMVGRIVDVAVAPATPGKRLGTVIYLGAATGGVWRSENGGVDWSPIFDSVRTGGVGAVAVAPSDPDVIWVGTGEPQNMRSSSYGTGVYKSTDGGATWSAAMLPTSQHIGRIVIDPRNPDVVYVAALGPLWAPGGERGLFKTTDGGANWTNVKEISKYTGVVDVALDPSDPDIVYAAAFERERREYGFLPAGPESGLFKSTDAGQTWKKLTDGFPSSGDIGRIGVSVCRSRPATLYAVVHAAQPKGGVYRSDDGGDSWRQVSDNNGTAWYYGQVRCDPTDPDHVVKLNVGSQESFDGGKTWKPFGTGGVHSDQHALWINPDEPQEEILGTDGGAYFTWDRGKTWDHVENVSVSQFYSVSVDDARPFYNVYGGLQDNSTYGGPSRTRNSYGPTNAQWFRMTGGDGFYAVPDPLDPKLVYAEAQNGDIARYDERIGQSRSIRPEAPPGTTYRYNWSAPILPSQHDARTLYFAANVVFRSTNRGDDWTVISPDLTRNIDWKKLPMRGSVPDSTALGRNEGTADFSNITTLAESPRHAGFLAAGTDDGVIAVTRDDGKHWTRVEQFPGVPDTTYVSRVIWSNADDGTLYATMDGHRSNDFRPYVLKSSDFGQTWHSIAGDLPATGSVKVIREHPRQPGLLFVGTDFDVFFTIDGGSHWTQLKSGIPGVPVMDLAIQSRMNDLVAGTHGRGIYILDDIGPLEHLAEAKAAGGSYLFPIRDELEYQPDNSHNSGMGSRGFAGQNPEPGARIAYLLDGVPAGANVALTITDAGGTVIRRLPVDRATGLHLAIWDMRVGAPLTGPLAQTDTAPAPEGRGGRGGRGGGGRGGFGGRGAAPAAATFLATPGSYRARLTITPTSGAPTVLERSFTLQKDPMVMLSDAELKALYRYRLSVAAAQLALRARAEAADTAQQALTALRRTIDGAKATVPAAARDTMAALEKEVREIVAQVGTAGRGGRGRGGAGGGGAGGAFGGRGRGGRGAGGADSAASDSAVRVAPPPEAPPPPTERTVQSQLNTLTELLNVQFMPGATQQQTLKGLPDAIAKQGDRIDQLRKVRIPALEQQLRSAGVQLDNRE